MKDHGFDMYTHLNDIIIDAGSLFFDLQVKQGRYIADVLAVISLDILPVQCGNTLFQRRKL